MNVTTTTAEAKPTAAKEPADPRTLDDLAALGVDALTALYQRGRATTVTALNGTPRCRMLSVRGLDRGPIATALRRFAAADVFPWAGKTFSAESDGEGGGINRVRLGGERRWFPFKTRVDASALDGNPCVVLDYGDPANPRLIRAIRDELREVAPGLFLGPAMLETGRGAPTLLLYFACDFTALN